MKENLSSIAFIALMIIMVGLIVTTGANKSTKEAKLVNREREYFANTSFIVPSQWKRNGSSGSDYSSGSNFGAYYLITGDVAMGLVMSSATSESELTLTPKDDDKSSKIKLIPIEKIQEGIGLSVWFEKFLANELKDKQVVFATQAMSKGLLERNGYPVVSKELLVGEKDGNSVYKYYFAVKPSLEGSKTYLIVLSSNDQQEYLNSRHAFLQFVYSLDF